METRASKRVFHHVDYLPCYVLHREQSGSNENFNGLLFLLFPLNPCVWQYFLHSRHEFEVSSMGLEKVLACEKRYQKEQ